MEFDVLEDKSYKCHYTLWYNHWVNTISRRKILITWTSRIQKFGAVRHQSLNRSNETLSDLNMSLFSNKLFNNSKGKSEEWKRFRVMQGLHSGSFYQKLCAMGWFRLSNPGQKQGCLINLGLALTNNQARGKFQKSGKNTLLKIMLRQVIGCVVTWWSNSKPKT